MREKILMNQGWKFHFGDIYFDRNRWGYAKSGVWRKGPEGNEFDDSDWENMTICQIRIIEMVISCLMGIMKLFLK